MPSCLRILLRHVCDPIARGFGADRIADLGRGRSLRAQRGGRGRRLSHAPPRNVRLFQPQLSRANSPIVKKADSSSLPAFPSGGLPSLSGVDPTRGLGALKDHFWAYRRISGFKARTFQGFDVLEFETLNHETLKLESAFLPHQPLPHSMDEVGVGGRDSVLPHIGGNLSAM